MTEQTGTELVAAEPTPRAHAHMMAISERSGTVAYATMADVIESAKLMSQAGFAVRKHFRGNPGACMAVIQQSLRWGMDAYAVANRSYFVNDQLAFESGVIQSVILVNAPIKGRIKYEFTGEGQDRRCRAWARLRDEPDEIVEYTSPRFGDIKPKNSPLWVSDPDQQHIYFSGRSFCRRHFPEVLLGVLDREEALAIDLENGEYRELPERETVDQKLARIAAPRNERKPRGSSAGAAAAQPAHDPDTGEIKSPAAKAADPAPAAAKSGEMPDLPKNLDRRQQAADSAPEKSEPVKVTSGKAERDPEADKRATEQEMAAAAGALDPDDDPFKEKDEEVDQPHPVRIALDAFIKAAPTAKSEEEMETLRKALLKEVKKIDDKSDLYKEAVATYQREFGAFQKRLKDATTASAAASSQSGSDISPQEEEELEHLLMRELDHAPRGIDTRDLHQVRAYVKGIQAAQKGRAITAVPAIYSEVETEAWKAGHRHRTENPVADEG